MSVIYGYINTTGNPVDENTLTRMRNGTRVYKPDGEAKWIDENAGMGYLLMYNTPEALLEKQPLFTSNNNQVLFVAARVDNRDELCKELGIPLARRDKNPDSYYILKAWEKWGEAAPERIFGDWSFAVWDKNTKKLILARDHHGITAMYYYKGNGFFVFSSSLKAILALDEVPKKINEEKLAKLLVAWNDGNPETSYQGIYQLPPAHVMTLSDGTISFNRYWYPEKSPRLKLSSEQEYMDAFLEIYSEAVRCRLRSHKPVGATLSGGLDSGSVCALAAPMLAQRGERLKAYCAVPLYDTSKLVPPNRAGDEGPLARATADFVGNIDLELLKSENISPVEGIEQMLEIQDQPIHAAGNAYWILDICKHARDEGMGTLLIGQGGNATVSWPYKGVKKTPAVKNWMLFIFWNTMILVPKFLRNKYLGKKLKKFCLNGNEKFIQDIFIKSRIEKRKLARDINEARISQFGNTTYSIWNCLGNSYNISFRDPTTDARLINFLLGLPVKFYKNIEKHAYFLKKAFANKLPNEILNNSRFGLQSADIEIRESDLFEKLKNKLDLQLSGNNLPRYLKVSLKRNTGNTYSLFRLYFVLLFLKISHDEKRKKIYQKELV